MLEDANVLVVEDESLIAEDISDWVQAAGGTVIGPAPTVAGALKLLQSNPVDAAILDGHLADRDITPVAKLLISRGVPVVVYSGLGLPEELAALHPDIPLVLKPTPAARVVRRLATLVREQLRPAPAYGAEINFQVSRVFVDDGSRTGRIAFSGGILIGILIPVTGDEQGENGAGGWYLEAGFGPCSLMTVGPPPIFVDLDEAAAWFSVSIAREGGAATLT